MLTRKQKDLLDAIRDGIARDGIAPTFDEMKDAVGLRSNSGIHRHLAALEERGFIRRLRNRARAIELIKHPQPRVRDNGSTLGVIDGGRIDAGKQAKKPGTAGIMELPMMGRIAAGVPIEAVSDVLDNIPVPSVMLSSASRHYALEVRGDSMTAEGINDGDVVVIRETKTANNGDIVVAFVDGHEATLKRFRRNGSKITLEAANPDYGDQEYRSDQVDVQGRLVGLIRTY